MNQRMESPVISRDVRTLDADVLVLGGGPAGTWAAWSAAAQGAHVDQQRPRSHPRAARSWQQQPTRERLVAGSGAVIELVSEGRCIGCDICVKVCPTNVFEAVPERAPIIARQDDCQTCFMCGPAGARSVLMYFAIPLGSCRL